MSTEQQTHTEFKPVVGITIGDYNGIGPEVILKTLADQRIIKICTPVVFGSDKIFNFYKKLLSLEEPVLTKIDDINKINPKKANLAPCVREEHDPTPGIFSEKAGKAAFISLKTAVQALKSRKIDALVTAPINKDNMQSDEFKFPGHTEYLADAFGASDVLMLLVGNRLRIGTVTGHVPLAEVSKIISADKIIRKAEVFIRTLKEDFGIHRPKIAVLGLNPHAGENGLLGKEEQEIIVPAIEALKEKGQLVFGPYPADGFFGSKLYEKFDGILALYHDQGLIPFKTIAFHEGVNYTAGLPAIRTSPDHGTAYDIAGKNKADENSFRQALFMACDAVKARKEYGELSRNALKTSSNPAISQDKEEIL